MKDIVNMSAGGGGPAEPVLYTGSELADDVKFNAKGGEPASHGFTMAEILLSLTIIGVVAAITLPSLTGNINERTWNTQRKALYARFSQAIALMPALNGYGTLTEDENHSVTADTAAETFVTEGLAKVLKINNICDSEHLADCGIPDVITPLGTAAQIKRDDIKTLVSLNDMFNGSFVWTEATSYSHSQIDTKAAAFETQNGESVLAYYYPYCTQKNSGDGQYYTQPKMCANFVFDLNGSKGPNTVGKDIGFITVFYPSDSVVVSPLLVYNNAGRSAQPSASSLCTAQDSETRLPNREELASIFVNKNLWGFAKSDVNGDPYFWSSELYSTTLGYAVNLFAGAVWPYSRDERFQVRCVRR